MPEHFVGTSIVVTEKLDGANTLLHKGTVYGRSTGRPSTQAWTAMARKHHAWKLTEPGLLLYGEDLYAVHSIAYGPIAEATTFRAFALRTGEGRFESIDTLRALCAERDILCTPTLFEGTVRTLDELRILTTRLGAERSALEGTREGVVVRIAGAYDAQTFAMNTAKCVRENHVQTGTHWRRNWRPCAIVERRARG